MAPRKRRPGRPTHQGQQQTLGEYQAHEPAASSAECHADGHLLPTVEHARQQHMGEVGAGHQEHQADRGPDKQQCRTHIAGDLAVKRDNKCADRAVGLVMFGCQARGQRVHFGLRLLFGGTGFEAGDHFQWMILARVE